MHFNLTVRFLTLKFGRKCLILLQFTKGNVWREQRKLFHSQFQESVAPDYMPLQSKAALDVARKIMDEPDELMEHIHMSVLRPLPGKLFLTNYPFLSARHVASFLMGMAYGTKMSSKAKELVQMADEVIMAWSKVAVPGAYLVSPFIPSFLLNT